ncbi:MAG: hypothetical protein KF847_03560 [Pirellulales bacterium]|nr:hypothetical protein [Pirellulales bacterium]
MKLGRNMIRSPTTKSKTALLKSNPHFPCRSRATCIDVGNRERFTCNCQENSEIEFVKSVTKLPEQGCSRGRT